MSKVGTPHGQAGCVTLVSKLRTFTCVCACVYAHCGSSRSTWPSWSSNVAYRRDANACWPGRREGELRAVVSEVAAAAGVMAGAAAEHVAMVIVVVLPRQGCSCVGR